MIKQFENFNKKLFTKNTIYNLILVVTKTCMQLYYPFQILVTTKICPQIKRPFSNNHLPPSTIESF